VSTPPSCGRVPAEGLEQPRSAATAAERDTRSDTVSQLVFFKVAPDYASFPCNDEAAVLSDPTAAILVIGNEILSGKVEEQNARYLIGELRRLGVSLQRVEVIPDVAGEIAGRVRTWSGAVDHLFTSGGVGPTHDDVTLQAVAEAFGLPVARDAELEALLRQSYGERLQERDLRMADLPVGARLEHGPGGPGPHWPVVVVRNVWILPGVPAIFRRKFETVRELFRAPPIHGRALYSRAGEGEIAGALDETVAAFPSVDVGSYPHLDAVDYRVKVTFDGRDGPMVDRALAFLAGLLGDAVAKTE
jgi:molybdenum cofactor synthesis domain-containing protein